MGWWPICTRWPAPCWTRPATPTIRSPTGRLAHRAGADTERLPELASRHNLKYWRNEPYLGLGLAACSYDGRRRSANVTNLDVYIQRLAGGQDPIASSEELAAEQRMGRR